MSAQGNRVLVLAHVFPRTLDDSMGAFLLHLADALEACGIVTDVMAPHAAHLADAETLGAAHVRRFHYAPAGWERLAYAGTMHELVGRGGWTNRGLFLLFNAAFLVSAIRSVWTRRPVLIHAHWCLPDGLVGALAGWITRRPLVVTTHGTDVEMLRRMRWARPLARWVFRRARGITCGSSYLRDQLLALGVADPDKVRVIPMPVHSLFTAPAAEPVARSNSTILTVARLTAQKSIRTLVDAVALLRDRGSPARLIIIGDGPERVALEAQVRDLNLLERVEFLGARPQTELPRYYAECAVFCLPSIREGMGLVLAEALLCGAPVIAAHSGGVTDIVQDGETGLLVPESDPVALAGAIERLWAAQGPELAVRLAANGRRRVAERFTCERVAAQFAQLYSEVHH